jgi:hypothetical protein
MTLRMSSSPKITFNGPLFDIPKITGLLEWGIYCTLHRILDIYIHIYHLLSVLFGGQLHEEYNKSPSKKYCNLRGRERT